jgi:hypothetical protein
MAWKEIDRDARITWLLATPDFLYKLRQLGGDGEKTEVALYHGKLGQWFTLDPPTSNVVQIAHVGGQLIVVDADGAVHMQESDKFWSNLSFPRQAAYVTAGEHGALYGLDRRGGIWAAPHSPDRWVQIDDLVENERIAVAGDTLYKKLSRGSIWRYTGVPMTGWKLVDNNPATVDLCDGGRQLLQIHDSLTVWQLPSAASSAWVRIDESGRAGIVVAHGDRIFQRRDDGHVLQYTGVPVTGWKDHGGPGSVADNLAVGPHSIYLYAGDRVYQNNV